MLNRRKPNSVSEDGLEASKCKSSTTHFRRLTMPRHFSSAVSTNQSRSVFVGNILTVYKAFNLDGIDIDWEYPGRQGEGDNEVNSNDSANFLSFLQLLRYTLPPCAVITAATLTTTFSGPDGQPMSDVSEFSKVLDWILLMNYDVWGGQLLCLSCQYLY